MSKSKTWVMLRGLTREQGHWGSFAEQFKKSFPELNILCLDLPGTGEKRHVKSPSSVSGIVEKLREYKKEQDLDGPIHLFAISLGGMVALDWAQSYPQEIASLVLINSSVSSLSPFYHRLCWQTYSEFIFSVGPSKGSEREEKLVNIVVNNKEKQKMLSQVWVQIAEERPITKATFVRQLKAAFTFKTSEKTLSSPLLVLAGLGDRMTDACCSKRIAEHFNGEIHSHPWAGHDLTTDDPHWVIDKFRQWLITQ